MPARSNTGCPPTRRPRLAIAAYGPLDRGAAAISGTATFLALFHEWGAKWGTIFSRHGTTQSVLERSIMPSHLASCYTQPHRLTLQSSMASRESRCPMANEGPVGQSRGGSPRRPPSAHSAIETVFTYSNISEANEVSGSQTGSHRCQFSGDTEPLSAPTDAVKPHVRPLQATSRHPTEVPSKQRVAGSNPAGRADQKSRSAGICSARRLVFMLCSASACQFRARCLLGSIGFAECRAGSLADRISEHPPRPRARLSPRRWPA
jgi:hypothetical protein